MFHRSSVMSFALIPAFVLAASACSKQTPAEPTEAKIDNRPSTTTAANAPNSPVDTAAGNAGNQPSTTTAASAAPAPLSQANTGGGPGGSEGGDPVNGKFLLADAIKGLAGKGDLLAEIDTSKGKLNCALWDDKAPLTVANFVGLARGLRPWKDPSGQWVKKPAYDGTTFHRIIKGFMIQGGDPRGNGTGEPGYVLKDEIWDGAKHDRAGLLCMANRGHNTNGQQFFITDAPASHLDGNYTIFGICSPSSVVHDIANVPVMGERPSTPVTINHIKVSYGKKPAAN